MHRILLTILLFFALLPNSLQLHLRSPAERDQTSLPSLSWEVQSTGSSHGFRGLAVVFSSTLWLSGTGGTVLRSVDSGSTWQSVGPALPKDLSDIDFRAIQAWSSDDAVVMSINMGQKSHIHVTNDGGSSWHLSFENDEPKSYLDCLWFENPSHGMALVDPIGGKFRFIETFDGGLTWSKVSPNGMALSRPGETGMAASNTCLTATLGRWLFVTGGVDPGRIFQSDGGNKWQVENSTVPGGIAGGIHSITFGDAGLGIMVGGDYDTPNSTSNTAAWSNDYGATWFPSIQPPSGYRSGSAWVPGLLSTAIAVGPTGSDLTVDGGKTWHEIDNSHFYSVACVEHGDCWASGPNGQVARLRMTIMEEQKVKHGLAIVPDCDYAL